MTETESRPRFFEDQYLGAADLTAVVDYSRSQLSRVVLGAHRWGIALGLDLVEVAGPNSSVDVFVEPGYAFDGFGRPLLVSVPTKLAAAQFAAFDAGFVSGGTPPPPVVVEVWLAYDETMTSPPRPGFQTCDSTLAYARVLESFRIEVGPRAALSSRRDPIDIAGRSVDAGQALISFRCDRADALRRRRPAPGLAGRRHRALADPIGCRGLAAGQSRLVREARCGGSAALGPGAAVQRSDRRKY